MGEGSVGRSSTGDVRAIRRERHLERSARGGGRRAHPRRGLALYSPRPRRIKRPGPRGSQIFEIIRFFDLDGPATWAPHLRDTGATIFICLNLLQNFEVARARVGPPGKSSEFARPRARKLACQAGLRDRVKVTLELSGRRARGLGPCFRRARSVSRRSLIFGSKFERKFRESARGSGPGLASSEDRS